MMIRQKCSSLRVMPVSHKKTVSISNKVLLNAELQGEQRVNDLVIPDDVDIDIREVCFLIVQLLSISPCQKTLGVLWNELSEHKLLPRRYHAWYSRSGMHNEEKDDDGVSFPLSYEELVHRYSHIKKDHMVKLLKQLMLTSAHPSLCMGSRPNAADVPTLLGSGRFSLLSSDGDEKNQLKHLPSYLRWPHMQADQVHALSLRAIGGGFTRHHRAPSIHAASNAIAKPSTMIQKMQNIKKLRGHRNAVYCAIFDQSGRYVITGSDDRLVKIWSMETAFCLASCRGHEGDITDLAVSSNNALVASASNDFVIRVWRLPDGVPISVLQGHTGAVTAIAFSPRTSSSTVYQLLSSSDDGTCRIWDARYSQAKPRIYVPRPVDSTTGQNILTSTSGTQQNHQILCCAYNANGTVFVTGSSDTLARVWSACKSGAEDPEQPNHEIDILCGHENDVNYVQFSGCTVTPRSTPADCSKEENGLKFKNLWFCHDNIVTCSRDGRAIFWIPRSCRSHDNYLQQVGKMKKWCGLSSSSSTSSNPQNPGNYNYPPPALPSPPLPLPAPPQAVKTHQSHVYQQPLLQIPGCTVHLMDGGDAVEIARGDLTLTRITDNNLRLATTVKVIGRSSTVQWPLTKDEPVVKLDDHHYLFTIPIREGDPLSYGVGFSATQIVRERLGGFDKFLRENSCFTDMRRKSSSGDDDEVDWKEFAPKIENYNGVLAQAIANGTGQIIRGIFTCSNAYTNLVHKGGESLLSRAKEDNYSNMKNSAAGRLQKTPSNGVGVAAGKNGNTALNYNLKRARDLSNMTASISKGMLDAIGVASGSTMGPLVRSKTGQAFFTMMPGEVVLASLDAVDKILSAAEAAQKHALKETSGATVKVVSEKYGDSAGVAAGDALAVAGNVAGTAWNVVKMRRAINPASFATSGLRNNKNQYSRY